MNQNHQFVPSFQTYLSYPMSFISEYSYPRTSNCFYSHHYNIRPSPPSSKNSNQLVPFYFNAKPPARNFLPDTYKIREKKKPKPSGKNLVTRISVINFTRQIQKIDKFFQNQMTSRRSLTMPAKKTTAKAIPNEYIRIRINSKEADENLEDQSEQLSEINNEGVTFQETESQPFSVETYESLSHLNISIDEIINIDNSYQEKDSQKNVENKIDSLDIDLNDFWRSVGVIEATEYSCFRTATLWSCIPESSGFLFSMSKSDKELQERWFEIYTSERSYNKTLKTLDLVLLNESKLILTFYDLNSVFILNEIRSIIEMSDEFLEECEKKLAADIKITTVFDVLGKMCNDQRFTSYIKYASSQYSQKENYDRIMNENQEFNKLMKCLLNDKRLEGRDVLSFLIAPLQRLPRYKLLVDAVLKLLSDLQPELYAEGKQISKYIDEQLIKANEKTTRLISYSEAIKLKLKMKYPNKNMIVNDLITESRELKFHGDLQLMNPILFSRFSRCVSLASFRHQGHSMTNNKNLMYHLILFNDILILTKKEIKDKMVYYFVKNIYEKHQVNADLSEWQSVLESSVYSDLNQTLVGNKSGTNDINLYLLTLSIFTKSRKYFFLCSKSDGDNWLKNLKNQA